MELLTLCRPTLRAGRDRARRRKHSRLATGLAAACTLQTVMLAGGCHGLRSGPVRAQRAFQPAQDPDTLSDVAFLHYLATVPVATVDEGMRAVLILAKDEQSSGTFEERFEALRQCGAVKPSWGLASRQLLDKGTLAHMLRGVCRLSLSLGEVLAFWTGLGDRRAALKTCIDAGLLPYGVWHEPVKGGELMSAITEAERHLAARGRRAP